MSIFSEKAYESKILSVPSIPASVKAELLRHFPTAQEAYVAAKQERTLDVPGIGPKRAEAMRKWLQSHPLLDNPSFSVGHYQRPEVRASQTLDETERKLINEVNNLISATGSLTRAVFRKLDELLAYERARSEQPLEIRGMLDYSSSPKSMMSDMLNIVEGSVDNRIMVYSHELDETDADSGKTIRLLALPRGTRARKSYKEAFGNAVTRIERARAYRAIHSGIIAEDGTKYAFCVSSPGQLKKFSGYWMEAETLKSIRAKLWNECSPESVRSGKKLAPTKFLQQFRALLFSSAEKSSRSLGTAMLLDHCIVVDSKQFKKLIKGNVLKVSASYMPQRVEGEEVEDDFSDGMFLINARAWGNIVIQVRGFGIKGLGVALDFEAYAEEKGYEEWYLVVDFWGQVHDLRKEEISVIMTSDVFKLAGQYRSWEAYKAACTKNGYSELYICSGVAGESDERNARLSRQMTQTLFGLDSDQAVRLAAKNIQFLDKLQDWRYISWWLGGSDKDWGERSNAEKACTMIPGLASIPAMREKAQNRYKFARNSAKCGELKICGTYAFAVADPTAFADVVFGKKKASDPNIGTLKANSCWCPRYANARRLIALRSPHAFHEWLTLDNIDPKSEFLGLDVMYFSVHDLSFRVLQMDFDGDHVLVVNEHWLADAVEAMQIKYSIPVVVYDPEEADLTEDMLMPLTGKKADFDRWLVNCVMECRRTNLVGPYSTLLTAIWSRVSNKMGKEEIEGFLMDAAIAAAGVNHAVDAQKTFQLTELPEDFKEDWQFKPFNQIAKDNLDESEVEIGKEIGQYRPAEEGIVDRIYKLVDAWTNAELPEYVPSEEDGLPEFNWLAAMPAKDSFLRKSLRTAWLSDKTMDLIRMVCGSFSGNRLNAAELDKLERGDLGFIPMLKLLAHVQISFSKAVGADNEFEAAQAKDARIQLCRKICAEYAQTAAMYYGEDLDTETALQWAATKAWRTLFQPVKGQEGKTANIEDNAPWFTEFVLDLFGDIYADFAIANIGVTEEELMDEVEEFVSEDAIQNEDAPDFTDEQLAEQASWLPEEDDGFFVDL